MTSIVETLQPFVCGGISACLGSAVIHPADLIKTRQQVALDKKSLFSMVTQILKQDGAKGLYVGLSTALTRQATYGTARIGLHRVISDKLELINGGQIPFYQKTLAGMVSGCAAVCIGSPFDIALVRIQNDNSLPINQCRSYKGVFDALKRITMEEGIARLWRGLFPNVLRGMAMNVGMMSSYDQAKQTVIKNLTHDIDPKNPSIKTSLISSAIAGVTCAVGSLPFDRIKSLLMNMKLDPNTKQMPFNGVLDCVIKIYQKEGVFAFWRGLPAYYFRCAPHSMIILLSVERITHVYRKIFGLEAGAEDTVNALRFHSSASFSQHGRTNDNDEQDFEISNEQDISDSESNDGK